jgi:hypothetical protein
MGAGRRRKDGKQVRGLRSGAGGQFKGWETHREDVCVQKQ